MSIQNHLKELRKAQTQGPPVIMVNANSNYMIPYPSGSPTQGDELMIHILANYSGLELTVDGSIRIPTDSMVSFPKIMEINKLYIAKLQFGYSTWNLVTLVGGY